MVRHLVAAAVVVAGCYHGANEQACSITCGPGVSCPNGLSCIDQVCRGSNDTCGGTTGDAGHDAFAPLDGCMAYGTGLFQFQACTRASTSVPMPATFDTDTDCAQAFTRQVLVNNMPVCVVYGQTVTVNGLVATGSMPLVLVADLLQVQGTLDVSGHFGGNADNGAGSGFNCVIGGSFHRGDGGAGGAAGGAGGAGGASDGAAINPGDAARMLSQLQGGCPGNAGDNSDSVNMHGRGGPGGGVLYLIGRSELVLSNFTHISAAGAHGEGGSSGTFGGGGGGGAGGLIALDSPTLIIGASVTLCANGGGGGGGGNGQFDPVPSVGTNGGDGCATTPASAGAPGGSGGIGGTGNGNTLTMLDGKPGAAEAASTDSAGGGGGGGGAGYIYVRGNVTPMQLASLATISPPAQ